MLLQEMQKNPRQVQEAIRATKIAQEEPERLPEQLQEAKEEKEASIENVRVLIQWVSKTGQELEGFVTKVDVRNARVKLVEMSGYLNQIDEQLSLLSKQQGLPDFK